MTFDDASRNEITKASGATESPKVDVLGLPSPLQTPQRRWVDRVRQPLSQKHLGLALLLVAALTGVVLLTLWQRSPVITSYVLGWYLSDTRVGYSSQQLASDSPLQPPSDPDQIGFERHLFALINKARQERGVALLFFNESLTRAAHAQAAEMGRFRRFAILDQSGKLPLERAQSAGYVQPKTVLEIVATGLQRPDQVMNALTDDPNAAQNLFSPEVNEIGTGYAYVPDDLAYHHYWVIDLGRRGVPAYTVVVNDGEQFTNSPNVILRIGGKGWARQMQVSNSPNFEDAAWEIYSDTRPWMLLEGTGLKQVYVKLRGLGGEIVTITGEISLKQP